MMPAGGCRACTSPLAITLTPVQKVHSARATSIKQKCLVDSSSVETQAHRNWLFGKVAISLRLLELSLHA